jgi:hypothetical protein
MAFASIDPFHWTKTTADAYITQDRKEQVSQILQPDPTLARGKEDYER